MSEPGTDPDLNEAIKIVLATSGFEVNDLDDIKLIELAVRNKLHSITQNAKFHARYDSNPAQQTDIDEKNLRLTDLKQALNEEKIKIDRPEYILQQPQTKNVSKRSKPK